MRFSYYVPVGGKATRERICDLFVVGEKHQTTAKSGAKICWGGVE